MEQFLRPAPNYESPSPLYYDSSQVPSSGGANSALSVMPTQKFSPPSNNQLPSSSPFAADMPSFANNETMLKMFLFMEKVRQQAPPSPTFQPSTFQMPSFQSSNFEMPSMDSLNNVFSDMFANMFKQNELSPEVAPSPVKPAESASTASGTESPSSKNAESSKSSATSKIDTTKPITTYGDSIAQGLGSAFKGKNLGVGSAGFLSPTIHFESLDKIQKGDQVVINLGYNDPAAAKNPDEYTKKVVDLVQKMQAKGATVAIVGIKAEMKTPGYNGKIDILNGALKKAAEQTNIQFVDISNFKLDRASDGLHYSGSGYKEFARQIKDALAK